jgi:hypothetical protein
VTAGQRPCATARGRTDPRSTPSAPQTSAETAGVGSNATPGPTLGPRDFKHLRLSDGAVKLDTEPEPLVAAEIFGIARWRVIHRSRGGSLQDPLEAQCFAARGLHRVLTLPIPEPKLQAPSWYHQELGGVPASVQPSQRVVLGQATA